MFFLGQLGPGSSLFEHFESIKKKQLSDDQKRTGTKWKTFNRELERAQNMPLDGGLSKNVVRKQASTSSDHEALVAKRRGHGTGAVIPKHIFYVLHTMPTTQWVNEPNFGSQTRWDTPCVKN